MGNSHRLVLRICRGGLFLALLCVIGMFSIPLGDNVKVSLQWLAVLVICFLADGVLDALLVTGCYLLLGLVLPIYAGFSAGITPTFGFVIGFVLATPVLYFMNKIPMLHPILRMALASLSGLLVVYGAGTTFMALYLQWDLGRTLLVSVVPYLPFDAAKIALAIAITMMIPSPARNRIKPKKTEEPEGK